MAVQAYNPHEMISKATKMKEQSAELNRLISNMQTAVENMGGVWQSPAQRRFSEKFAEIHPQLSSFSKSIDSFADRAIDHANSIILIDPV